MGCSGSELEGLFAIVNEGLLGDLEAGDAQVALVEGLVLVVPVTVLSPHLVRVQVLLSLPGGAVEEIHRCVETTGCNRGLASLGGLHRDVMIETTLVCDLLSEVVPGLEPRIGKGLSGGRGHLGVVDAGMRDGQRGLSIAVVNGVHGAVSAGNARGIEPELIIIYSLFE
jgi:hypothetical protein